jgi:hypothetical protein
MILHLLCYQGLAVNYYSFTLDAWFIVVKVFLKNINSLIGERQGLYL